MLCSNGKPFGPRGSITFFLVLWYLWFGGEIIQQWPGHAVTALHRGFGSWEGPRASGISPGVGNGRALCWVRRSRHWEVSCGVKRGSWLGQQEWALPGSLKNGSVTVSWGLFSISLSDTWSLPWFGSSFFWSSNCVACGSFCGDRAGHDGGTGKKKTAHHWPGSGGHNGGITILQCPKASH